MNSHSMTNAFICNEAPHGWFIPLNLLTSNKIRTIKEPKLVANDSLNRSLTDRLRDLLDSVFHLIQRKKIRYSFSRFVHHFLEMHGSSHHSCATLADFFLSQIVFVNCKTPLLLFSIVFALPHFLHL